jgi:hypothetical protein
MAIVVYKMKKKRERDRHEEEKKNTDNINDLRHRMITIRAIKVIYDTEIISFCLSYHSMKIDKEN